MNPWGYGLRDLRRRRRRTASVERITTVDVVRHRWCRKVVGITIPRVHPSGITRGYAWCVPSGDSGCGLGGFFFLSLSTLPLHFSTGSPFGHHPRLRIVCPHRGQWVNSCEVRCTSPHTAWKVCTLSVDIHLLCHHFSGETEQGNSSPPEEAHHA